MKHIQVEGVGAHARLTLSQRPLPTLSPEDVLIKICAAGINRADILQRKGKYPPPPGASDILGLEVSGHIHDTGKNVTTWRKGQPVCALLEGGGYAEYVAVKASQVMAVPEGVDLVHAAALPEAACTVWSNLFDYAHMQPGERLLVHGGASGIGTVAIQLAKACGITCYTTAGTAEKCQFVEGLGAVRSICYRTEDFAALIEAEGGVDVVLDMVGGEYFQKNMQVLKPHGRLVSISFLKGANAEVNFAPMLLKNLTLMGTTLRNKSQSEKAALCQAVQEQVWPLYTAGKIKPIIDSTFPLSEAQAAHERMEAGAHVGKIVLKVV